MSAKTGINPSNIGILVVVANVNGVVIISPFKLNIFNIM